MMIPNNYNYEIKSWDMIITAKRIIAWASNTDIALYKSDSIYDCIVPVSGGKDGSYVASKIRDELNWQPKESFETGIDKTIHWYLENRELWKAIQDNTYQQERLGVVSE